VLKAGRELFEDVGALDDSVLNSIREGFCRFPSDTCYIAVRDGKRDIRGYAFLDACSCAIDIMNINEMDPAACRKVKRELLSSIAAELNAMGVDSLIETNVDQLECQRLTHHFEVCGRYETLAKG
jgi:hypothetical protein